MEVSSQCEVNCGAYFQFMCMNHLRRKRHLAGTITIFQGIPGFWVKNLSFLLLLGDCLSGGGRIVEQEQEPRPGWGWWVGSGVGQGHRKGAGGP